MPSYVRGRERRRLSDAEILEAYTAGEDSAEVAHRAGCSDATVRNIVRRLGGTVRQPGIGRGARTLTDAEICQRYRAGASTTEVAAAANTTTPTVRKILLANRVPMRPSNRPKGSKATKPAQPRPSPDPRKFTRRTE